MYHFIIGFCENLYLNRHKFLYLFFEKVIMLHCPSRFYMVLIVFVFKGFFFLELLSDTD